MFIANHLACMRWMIVICLLLKGLAQEFEFDIVTSRSTARTYTSQPCFRMTS